MRLDQMTVALRVRSPWQAMDLGLRMVRANAVAIWKPYFLVAGSAFILCNLFAYAIDQIWLGWFLIWWLKPVFDRIPLHVLSHVTFGSYPNFRDTLRAPFQWRFGLLVSWLTYRRFSFWRSISMPIDILEGLRTDRLSMRRSVLIGAISTQVVGLSFVCLLFEWVLLGSFFALFYMFVPIEYLSTSIEAFFTQFMADPDWWMMLIFNCLYFLSVMIVSPFFVGAGFAAYLNRRTQLEAWDIEIAFKRIAARLRQTSAAAFMFAGLMFAFGMSPVSQAEVAPKEKTASVEQLLGESYRAEPKAVADAVEKAYRDKNLSQKETYRQWVPKNKPKPPKPSDLKFPWLQGLIESISVGFGLLAEYGLWLLLAVLLSWLIWKSADWMPWMKDILPEKRKLDELSEKDVINLADLPTDLSNAVRKLWAQQPRAALALLYRGSVEKLADRLGVPFPPGATEAECVRRSRKLEQPESVAVFQQVVRAWQAAAYAHRLPDSEQFEALLSEWSLRWEKRT